MTGRRPSTNIFLISFAAIVGMLSFGDVASACTTKPAAAPPACCAVKPPGECGCCGEAEQVPVAPLTERLDAVASASTGVILRVPSSTCECRANEPAAPSDRPAQRTGAERTDVERGEVVSDFLPALKPAPSLSRLLAPTESPPKSPLYLRTSRLLI